MIAIKGMEMPKEIKDCPLSKQKTSKTEGTYYDCRATKEYCGQYNGLRDGHHCPLVEIKEVGE